MHTLESYALNSGAKISKPYIIEKFFPTTLNKYITLDCDARVPSKHYDFWQEVVDIVGPILLKEGITILQIGREKDPNLQGTYPAIGQTNINQTAYLIKNSLLHVGPDNESTDIASHYNKKIVALFGNCLSSQFGPYWSDELDISLLHPERKNKPSYAFEEDPKSINKITPEQIASQICKHLNLEFNFKYKYSYIGARYNEPKFNLIPNVAIQNYNTVPRLPISIRADLHLDEQAIADTLQVAPFEIVTNKPLNPQLISAFRQRIKNIIYIVEEENEPNFIRYLMNNAVSYRLISFMDEEKLNPIKLDYMDYGTLSRVTKLTKSDVEQESSVKITHYKSNKFVLSEGKIYNSLAAWKRGLDTNELVRSPQPIIDDPLLWEESDNYCFLSLTES